jgi:protein ImuB
MPPLVRRILIRPEPIRTCAGISNPRGLRISGIGAGSEAVKEAIGPYVVSGGWWKREVIRRYWYVRLESGSWLWIYHDARRRRWYRHGEVE